MNTTPRIQSITVTHHDHAGYPFVEFEGTFYKGCRRCGGTGHYSFNGFDSICYLCGNSSAKLGDELGTLEQAQAWCEGKAKAQAQRDAKKERERLAKLAKRSAAWDALEAAHPDVWALLTSVVNVRAFDQPDGDVYPSSAERSSFVLSLADKLWKLDEIKFTERQIEALKSVAAKRVAEKAEQAAHPAPSGRVAVTGEVVSTRVTEGDYGTSYKMLVKADEGFKVWVSIPSALLETTTVEEAKGRRVTFTATLQPSADDASFAFGSRPSKGSWI